MNTIVGACLLVGIYLTLMLIAVWIKKDNSLGNFTWGVGTVLVTLYTFFTHNIHNPRHILLTSLIVFWGIRLGIFFYSRYKKGADPRFVAWQLEWGSATFFLSFLWIFIAQGALLVIMSVPAILVNRSPLIFGQLNWLDYCALVLWCIGFYFESVSDYQLYRFMKNPLNKGNVMDQGLWRYSRHPNYFGEMLMWWSIFLIALSSKNGIYAIIAPVTITILLRYITGVPLLEATFKDNPEYQAYKNRTNMLIPWWPKN